MKLHETHNWRYSDSSLYDAVCINCNYTDESPQAHFPCSKELPPNLLLDLAKQVGLKAQSELALSPQEQKFAELIIHHCGQYTNQATRKIMFKYLGIEE